MVGTYEISNTSKTFKNCDKKSDAISWEPQHFSGRGATSGCWEWRNWECLEPGGTAEGGITGKPNASR